MRRRITTATLVVVGLLALGVAWFIRAQQIPEPELAPLAVERQQVGQLPQPPGLKSVSFGQSTLVDFDGDGVPEVLTHGLAPQRGGLIEPAFTAWLALKDGTADHAKLLALMPSTTTAQGDYTASAQLTPNNLPLAREVVAWNPKAQEPLVVQRTSQGWQRRAFAALKGERLQTALAMDLDKDGLLDNYLLHTQSGKVAFLKLDSNRRLQMQRVEPSLTPELEALVRKVRAMSLAPPVGVAPAPQTVSETRLRLPDLDGDGAPEYAVAGDWHQQRPAELQLSRSGRALKLPLHEFTLGSQLKAVPIERRSAPTLIVLEAQQNMLQATAFQLRDDRLQPIAKLQLKTQAMFALHWLRDLDGDGAAELIVADAPHRGARRLHWRVFRYQSGAFREVGAHEQRLPARMSLLRKPIECRDALVVTGMYESPLASLTGAGGSLTLLAIPPRGADALNPTRWKFTYVADVEPFWSGDYDSDGVEELCLSGSFKQSCLLQIRDGEAHKAHLSDDALAAVLPARVNGEPQLVVVYRRGQVERVRVQASPKP